MQAHIPRPSLSRVVAIGVTVLLVAIAQAALPQTTAAKSPSCTRHVHVDRSGRTDVTSRIQRAINASRNGAVICFGRHARYRVNGTIHIEGRSHLTLRGRGATFFQTKRSTTPIWLIDGGGTDISLSHMTIKGANPRPGTWDAAYEHNHGVQVGGTAHLRLGHVRIRNVGGDGMYLGAAHVGSGVRWAGPVRLHHSLVDGTGRSGISIADGAKSVTIDHNRFRHIAFYTLNIEPNGMVWDGVAAGARHVRFSHNSLGRQPYGTGKGIQPVGYVFVVTGSSGGGPADDVLISRNRIHGKPFKVGVFNNGGLRRNIRVVNNRSDTRAAGPVMSFDGVRTLTVTGNRQPLSRGKLVETSGCSDIRISGNVIK